MEELSDFIVETINQIARAIEKGNSDPRLRESGAAISPMMDWQNITDKGGISRIIGWNPWNGADPRPIQPIIAIDFDVAVTFTQESGAHGKIGIFSGLVGAGGGIDNKNADTQVSRVKFTLPLLLPTQQTVKQAIQGS